MRRTATTWDAVVAGAGPAGAVAALALAREGASVLLVERARLPRGKVCGGCLGPGALAGLVALGEGDIPARAGAVPLAHMLLRGSGGTARLDVGGWAALSRTTLDRELVRAAERAGATVWTEAKAALGPMAGDARRVRIVRGASETEVEARIVVDATGLGRGLAEGAGPATRAAPNARVGIGAELDAPDYPVAAGELHMAIARGGYVGLVRVETGRLNVAAAVDATALRGTAPDCVVAGILRDAGLPPLREGTTQGWRGTPALTRSGDAGGARLLRLGDAAGYVEPFTGEGIGWAIADGLAAARMGRVALTGSPAEALEAWLRYRAARRVSGERLCRALAEGLRRPWLVGLAVRALRAVPELATPLVRRAARDPSRWAAVLP